MPLSTNDRVEINRLGIENVRLKLAYAGPGPGSVVPGLGNGMMLRGDVEDWLAERSREAAKLQVDTLWWAKVVAWVGGIGIVVAIAIAARGA